MKLDYFIAGLLSVWTAAMPLANDTATALEPVPLTGIKQRSTLSCVAYGSTGDCAKAKRSGKCKSCFTPNPMAVRTSA